MNITKDGKVLKPDGKPYATWINNNGYECLKIKGKHYTVHRLVASSYCEGYKEGYHVNHKDGNRKNNCAENLEWVTPKENIQDMMKRGTHNISKAQEVAMKNHRKPCVVTYPNGEQLRYPSIKEAALANACAPNKAVLVCQGKRKQTKGLIFSYDIV